MTTPQQFRTPMPFFIPAISVALVFGLLFWVGLREQDKLVASRVEQVIRQHEMYANMVADSLNTALQQAEKSVSRYSRLLTGALAEAPAQNRLQERFAQWTEALPDGAVRTRREAFDSHTQAGIWVSSEAAKDNEAIRLYASAKEVTEIYGQGSRSAPYVNTWFLLANGSEIIYWPDNPDFVFNVTSTNDYLDTDWVQLTNPRNNPAHETRWTKLSFDGFGNLWMTSVVTPVFHQGQWLGSAGHDIPLDELLKQTRLLGESSGSYFVLLTQEQHIVASDRFAEVIKASSGTLTLSQLGNTLLSQAATHAEATKDNPFKRLHIDDHEVFVALIPSQNWLLINAIPLTPITHQIRESFVSMRNIAVAALVAELGIAMLLLSLSHLRARRQYNHLASMQEQLLRSEQSYRSLVDNMPGIVYRCYLDEKWTGLYMSPGIEAFAGYPAKDFMPGGQRDFVSLIHPDDRQFALTTITNAVERNKPYVTEYRILRKSGAERWVLDHGHAAQKNSEGNIELEGVILDITELKQAQSRLRVLNDSLEEQVEARTAELSNAIHDLETFNYAVSHDLKAPVRQVSGFLEAIKEELPTDSSNPEIQDMIRRCQNALGRMKEMIASLHAYSQLRRDSLTLTPVNINDLLSYLVENISPQIRNRLQLDIPPIDNVMADRTLMRIVLHHLLDNAIKFTAQAEHPQIRLIDHSTSAEWMLEIRDNGVGFNPAYHDNLFQMFQRLHPPETFPGYGVGLALVHKILSLHGGSIRAETKPGQGSSFFISIPVKAIRSTRENLSV